MESKKCKNCGALYTGGKCDYCGTIHDSSLINSKKNLSEEEIDCAFVSFIMGVLIGILIGVAMVKTFC